MPRLVSRIALAAVCGAGLIAAGCSGSGISNTIAGTFGAKGLARLIDASPSTAGPLSLTADGGTIDNGITSVTQIGNYASVSSGSIAFAVQPGGQSTNTSVSPSTNYSEVLEGEPGFPDYILFGFKDIGTANSPNLIRVKVNQAAPDISGAVDFYLWPVGFAAPSVPLVAGLTLNTDSGTVPNAPGDSYIPKTTNLSPPAMFQASANFNVAVVASGTLPNGTTDLLDGSGPLLIGNSYSFTLEDANGGAVNSIGLIISIDEPLQPGDQQSQSITRRGVR